MKISYNWISDYIDLDISPEELGDVLTDIGLEVEGMSTYKGPGGGMEGLVVGRVKSTAPHPDADRLKVTTVDAGTGEDLQIVCGAPNVVEGQKVVVATVGTTIYPMEGEPFKIKKAKIRGIESRGMICAEDEIGVGNDHDGIIALPTDTQIGTPVRDYYGIKEDYIYEIGLTPNRADATGHLGVARDLQAALTLYQKKDRTYQHPELKPLKLKDGVFPIKVEVEDTEACPRYSGISLENIEVKDSPDWLQHRLLSIGLRPINNVVDITNYVLMEYGQPLHAFDAEAITGNKVIVRKLPSGSTFVTLDEVERKLTGNDLMICNQHDGMCIAGVFGGMKSGVTESTTKVFLESAYFEAVTIRKTANRFNLRTDAAQRYEKGTDPNITIEALTRAVNLLQEHAGATVVSDITDVYPEPAQPFKVELNYERMDRLIGHSIDRNTVKTILKKLEIKIEEELEEGLWLSVPPFKVDVRREADIVEEVLRIFGFNNIPLPDSLTLNMVNNVYPDKEKIYNTVADYLSANGFNEIVVNSIVDGGEPEKGDDVVRLMNSLTADLNALRNNTLNSGLQVVSYNLNRRNLDLKLYEFGKTYTTGEDGFSEAEHLSMYLTGARDIENWRQPKSKPVDFFTLKAAVELVLKKMGVANFDYQNTVRAELNFGMDYLKNGKTLVSFGPVNESYLSNYDIKQELYYADFNWSLLVDLAGKQKIKYQEVSKFPGTRRDLALLLDKSVNYFDIQQIAVNQVKRVLKAVDLFDVYEDEAKLGKGKKSYAVSFFLEDSNKTLTDKEVDKIMGRLVRSYEAELKAEIR